MTESVIIRSNKVYFGNNSRFFKEVEKEKWETDTFDVLDKFIKPEKIFLDIGAWIGALSIYAAKLGTTVFAIEPDDVAFSQMIENIELNEHSENIFACNLAISNTNGEAQLNSNAYFGNSESSLVRRTHYAGEKTVPTKTLASFLFEHKIKDICLIKIDCEGSESIFIDEGFRDPLIEYDYPPVLIAFHPAWIQDINKFTEKVLSLLYPIYDFTSTATNKKYLALEFRAAMKSDHDHHFLLTAKR